MKQSVTLNNLLIQGAKVISKISQTFNLGSGSTWPGHIALSINEHVIEDLLQNSLTSIILIIGTNGKTTTGRILTTILKENKLRVIQNTSGANLLNGLASTLLLSTNSHNRLPADYAVFEVDENNLPLVLQHLTPNIIIALNLFRDQLDRYGELDSIAKKWNRAFQTLPETSKLILNADDPLIAYVAKDVKAHVEYFGADENEKAQTSVDHAADSIYCPQCGSKLSYDKIFYSHLGVWECPNCHVKRPLPLTTSSFYPLPGTYNKYNTLAAVLASQVLNIPQPTIESALRNVTPAFGRQEKLTVKGKRVQIFLSKNPTSFNESLRTIAELGAKTLLIVLNDRIPDGRDISWIWDVDFEQHINRFENIIVSGDRTYDMALRVHYSGNTTYQVEENVKEAVKKSLALIMQDETLYILPTYSAMLDVRKLLTGRKIL